MSGDRISDELTAAIASELAREDGLDPNDQHGGLYELRWSGGSSPEPLGDAWQMDYLPTAERIVKAILPLLEGGKGDPVAYRMNIDGQYFVAGSRETLLRNLEACHLTADIEPLYTAPQPAAQQPAGDGRMSDETRAWLEGMSVSVDVSTCDSDAQHRYMGTITEVMDDSGDKHGVTLLVQDAEPNFERDAGDTK